jgi:hypothetical protein
MQNREEFRQKGHDKVGVKNDCKNIIFRKKEETNIVFRPKYKPCW